MSSFTATPTGLPRSGRTAFLRRALTDQAAIGAIAPTSASLAGRLVDLIPATTGLRVLELGAGTGAISAAIDRRLGPGATHIALERDPALLAEVGHVAPRATPVLGDAVELATHVQDAGLSEVDLILSSLPWSNFDPAVSRRIIAAACSVLAPSGAFATIAYRPTRLNPRSRRFRRLLASSFTDVVATGTTWASLPPARLLVCREPVAGSRGPA
ncbi:methyltransferase domain-containing protein [Actinomycetospora endophytica]|uniref:Methyltransferase domain-containing protein n=1 Tax=Actinomycetospora endophytica TaxID=2291215 RepID=A0ABS8PD31_9PSEU|nr:methyltransferase domain-containing protein [Actinomycetospora endophytica]MCD2195380.1 methyltransferase domain-containing protein [Actinomycetospora endophytica]